MNPGNSGYFRIVVEDQGRRPRAFGTGGEDRWETVGVQTTTLDRLVSGKTIDLDEVSIAWIDTEGHEPYLLGR